MVYFSSDFHFGHKAIIKYRTNFSSIEEHDNHILERMSKLTKRDDLFILGDFLFDCDKFEWYLKEISKMPLKIKLVLGNHDSLKLYTQDIAKNIELQLPLFSYKSMWISHCPIHPDEMRNRVANIHGHLHNAVLDDDRYFDVGLDKNNYEFVSLDFIKTKINYNERIEQSKTEKSLESVYGSFKNISSNLDEKTVTKDFWKKEKENIEIIVKRGKEERKSIEMSFNKLHKKIQYE